MASLRDAHKRLEVIYKATAPEQTEADAADASMDEFSRLKKKVHQDMKQIRQVRTFIKIFLYFIVFERKRSR